MVVSQKFVSVSDNIIDCIPIVSSVSNIAQALYKLACKVDAFNPAAPREATLKRTLQIHIFSKSSASHFLASIPVLGNLCMLVKLVLESLVELKTPLEQAIHLDNKEVVSLSLENRELEKVKNPEELLRLAAKSSTTEILDLFLKGRNWSSQDLLHAMIFVDLGMLNSEFTVPKLEALVKYWKETNKQAEEKDCARLVGLLHDVLKLSKVGLARQIIEILPNQTPFSDRLDRIFCEYAITQFDSKGDLKKEALLNKEAREALMEKVGKSTIFTLIEFLRSSSFKHEADFEIFYQLFEKGELEPRDIKTAISYALRFGRLNLGEALFGEYKDRLALDLKIEIFKDLLSYEFDLDKAQTLIRLVQQSSEQHRQEIASLYRETVISAYTDSLIVPGKEKDVTILKEPLEAFKVRALALLEDLTKKQWIAIIEALITNPEIGLKMIGQLGCTIFMGG